MKPVHALYILALCGALALKWHYSSASVSQLRWILAPTAALVQATSQEKWVWEDGEGYVSENRMVVIAPACAGVNFLIVVFCLTIICCSPVAQRMRSVPLVLGSSLAAAFVVTVAANAARIGCASFQLQSQSALLASDSIHRITGVAVFCSVLFLYHSLLQRVIPAFCGDVLSGQTPSKRSCPGGALLPLALYLAVTIAVPFVLGAVRSPNTGLARHAAVTAIAGTGVFLAFASVKLYRHRRWLQKHGRAVGLKSGATVPQHDVILSARRTEFLFPKRHKRATGVLGKA